MPQQPSSAVPAVVPLSLGLAKDDFFYLFYYILFVKKKGAPSYRAACRTGKSTGRLPTVSVLGDKTQTDASRVMCTGF